MEGCVYTLFKKHKNLFRVVPNIGNTKQTFKQYLEEVNEELSEGKIDTNMESSSPTPEIDVELQEMINVAKEQIKGVSKDIEVLDVYKEEDYLKEYNAAVLLDKENYVHFFGSEEEKESLNAEKEALKKLEKAKHLEKIALLEKEEKAKKLAEELEIKQRAEKLLKEKQLKIEKLLIKFNSVEENYLQVVDDIKCILKAAYSLQDLSTSFYTKDEKDTIEKIDCQIKETEKSIYLFKKVNKFIKISSSSDPDYIIEYTNRLSEATKNLLEIKEVNPNIKNKTLVFSNRTYPIEITANLYKTYNNMLNFIFDYAENNLIQDEYSFKVYMDKTEFYPVPNKLDVSYYFDIQNKQTKYGLELSIRINYIKHFISNKCSTFNGTTVTKETVKDTFMQPELEKVFFKIISRQWHSFETSDKKENIGIKKQFLNEAKNFCVKEKLENWSI